MDTSWIDLSIGHPDYVAGCMEFIDFAKVGHIEGVILCPCKKLSTSQGYVDNTLASVGRDDMNGLLKSTFGIDAPSNAMQCYDQENDEYIEESFEVLTNDSTSIEDDKYK
ncbi:unnamed protein product [Amaranthus hypochondriacus]